MTRFYPRVGTDPKRRLDVAQQVLDTLGEGARLDKSALRIRAQSPERLEAKCREVLAAPPRDANAAIVILLKKLADTSDGSAPGHRAEAVAITEREREQRVGAERHARAAAWLATEPDTALAIERQLDAEGYATDPNDSLYHLRAMMRRNKAQLAWTAAGEPEVQHA